jgi:hypothetical protein
VIRVFLAYEGRDHTRAGGTAKNVCEDSEQKLSSGEH